MMRLTFKDGQIFDTSGPMRVERRFDGLYVVGGGTLCPVNDYAEAERVIEQHENMNKRVEALSRNEAPDA